MQVNDSEKDQFSPIPKAYLQNINNQSVYATFPNENNKVHFKNRSKSLTFNDNFDPEFPNLTK